MVTRAILMVLMFALPIALAGCGDDSSPPAASGDAQELRSIVGAPLSGSRTEVVIETEEGERRFVVAPEHLDSVSPGHIASHVGVANLAFRIWYHEIDGVEHAVAADEIDLQTEPVEP
jgi:hypothetical protein